MFSGSCVGRQKSERFLARCLQEKQGEFLAGGLAAGRPVA